MVPKQSQPGQKGRRVTKATRNRSVCARACECGPHIVLCIDAGALADELLDHLEVPLLAGYVERRPTSLPRRRQDSAERQQVLLLRGPPQ